MPPSLLIHLDYIDVGRFMAEAFGFGGDTFGLGYRGRDYLRVHDGAIRAIRGGELNVRVIWNFEYVDELLAKARLIEARNRES